MHPSQNYGKMTPTNTRTSANKHKKSVESDVTPAGIKSYKFLFVLKKNLFCSIQEIDGLEKWTK